LVTTLEEKGIYGLVGSPERLKILEELRTGPKDRGYFINLLHLWPQAVKYHVDILVKGKLVAERWSQSGRRKKIYSLTKDGERAVARLAPGKRSPGDDWVDVFLGSKGKAVLSYLASISDGKWHDLKEARRRVGDRELEVLQRNDMLSVDGRTKQIRMNEFNLTIDSDWVKRLAGRSKASVSKNGDSTWST
jgi:DNA-binding MarR family transcriptional regulator